MNESVNDDLERLIDETAASMTAGEPQRVNGSSVRQAIDQQPTGRSRFAAPLWLALAAVLIAAFSAFIKRPHEDVNSNVTGPGRALVAPAPGASPSPGNAQAASGVIRANTRRLVPKLPLSTTEAPYEGLPRIVIAPIDAPEQLATAAIDASPIHISRIEITPLELSNLDNEYHH